MIRRTRVEIDSQAIVGNARDGARRSPAPQLYAVVKADAYGHGAVAVARALTEAKAAAGFCVSLVEEGVALREAGVDRADPRHGAEPGRRRGRDGRRAA